MRRLSIAVICATVVVVSMTATALGLSNNLSAWTSTSTQGGVTSTQCFGKNTTSSNVSTLGVSYRCEYNGSATSAPASTCSSCSSVQGNTYVACPAGGGPLHSGSNSVRSKADGWHVHSDGTRHDAAAVFSGWVTTVCP